jgi:DNA-binding transcriptional LysR family regulator
MHRTLRRLPSLDFLRGFEAVARRLSFTHAAEELYLTQSALSRQVKALEEALGTPLFERRHRALALTPAGVAFHHEVVEALRAIAAAADRLATRVDALRVTTTVAFASLWVIPRLPAFRASHPDIEVYLSANDRFIDLDRGEVDLAIRYLGENVPANAVRLFGERMLPVVAPSVLKRAPLRKPADLAHHVLLHFSDPEGRLPWLHWPTWLAANGEGSIKPAGSLRFSLYDQLIQAAAGGQGVALGRLPLVQSFLDRGQLVAPFPKRFDSQRGYYVVVAPHAVGRPDVDAFVAFLRAEAAKVEAADVATASGASRRRRAKALPA